MVDRLGNPALVTRLAPRDASKGGRMKKSLYDILQVSSSADVEVIQAAHSKLQEKLKNISGADAENERKLLQMASDTLSDADKRRRYDQERSARDPERPASQPAPATVASPVAYRSEWADTFMEWWSSPKMTALVTAAAVLVGLGLYLNYSKEDRKTAVTSEKVSNEKIKIEKIDAGRVENERVFIDRVIDTANKEIDYSKDVAHRVLDQRQQQIDHSRRLTEQRMEMERQRAEVQQQTLTQNKQRMEEMRQRQLDAQAEAAARARHQQERTELCRIERERYGRSISCN